MKIPRFYLLALVFFHLLMTFVCYDYIVSNHGDANLYWFNTKHTANKFWMDLLNYGTDSVLFLNYFFAKILNLPFYFGFILYSSIGFIGILQFYKLINLWVGKKMVVLGVNILPLVLFLPNMHFWTSILGKEPILFLSIVLVFIAFVKKRYYSLNMLLSLLVILIIRPHFFLLLFFAMSSVLLIYENWSLKRKVSLGLIAFCFLIFSFFGILKLAGIDKFGLYQIEQSNDNSLLSMQFSNSYIPMNTYTYPEKLFAFYFRPLFFDIHSYYGFFVSIENLIVLLFHIGVLILVLKNRKMIRFDLLTKVIFIYASVAAVLFVQRYSDLGLIIRTKALIQPFLILALLKIVNDIKFIRNEVKINQNNHSSSFITEVNRGANALHE